MMFCFRKSLFGAGVFVGLVLVNQVFAAAAQGNCPSQCVSIIPGDVKSVSLVAEWDEEYHYQQSNGCYWYRAKFENGRDYTISVTGCSNDSLSLSVSPIDYEGPNVFPIVYDFANGDRYVHVDKEDWMSSDPAYYYFYIYIRGNVGDKATLRLIADSLTLPEGASENPYLFTSPGETVLSKSVVPIDNIVYGRIWLQGGVRYRFETKNAAQSDSVSLNFGGSCEVTPVAAGGAYDKAYAVVAPETGYYVLRMGMSSSGIQHKHSLTVSYGKDSKLPIGEHEITARLALNASVSFVPGRQIRAGSLYDDDIIDDCLFSLSFAEAGRFYQVETVGASASLLGMIYDVTGSVVQQIAGHGSDISMIFRPDADGQTWYVGVCETGASLSGKSISIKVTDITDLISNVTFDPSPGSLADSERTRSVARGSKLGTLPVPYLDDPDLTFADVWVDANGTEYTAESVVAVSQLTLFPKWTSKFSKALDSNLIFTRPEPLPWDIETSQGYESATCATSNKKIANNKSVLKSEFAGAGNLVFKYKFFDGCNTWVSFSVTIDGVAHTLDRGAGQWMSSSYALDELPNGQKHTVEWIVNYSKGTKNDNNRVLLDQVRFEPALSQFTINWTDGDGVQEVRYTVNGGESQAAINGTPFDVERGALVKISAVPTDWHMILTDLSNPFDPSVTDHVELSAKAITGENVLSDHLRPKDIGITDGIFGLEPAGSKTLAKVVDWAIAQSVPVSAINGMTFEKNPQTALEKAFLLNCAEAQVNAKAENFRIRSLSEVNGKWVIDPANGSEYGNGHVEVRTSLTPEGPFTIDIKGGEAVFYRIFLVK